MLESNLGEKDNTISKFNYLLLLIEKYTQLKASSELQKLGELGHDMDVFLEAT